MQVAQQPTLPKTSVPKKSQSFLQLVIAGAIATTGFIAYNIVDLPLLPSQTAKTVEAKVIVPQSVTALGRLEPQGEVLNIAAPGSSNRIAQLLVKQGDQVKKGQILAILDSRDRLQAELEQAKEQVLINQARLVQIKAGAKTGEITAQESTMRKLEAQWQGEQATQLAELHKLEAQIDGDTKAQTATLRKLEAQLVGDIATQTATVQKLVAALKNAQAEEARYGQLQTDGAVSASIYDSKVLTLETSQQQLQEAKANLERIRRTGQQQIQEAQANLERIRRTGQQQIREAQANLERINRTGQQQVNEASSTLDKIAEVRPVDVQVAQREVTAAQATVKKAQAELDLVYVRSPREGQIIKIHTQAGEIVSNKGIFDLGQTQQMVAVAEIYESDIQRVRLGQTAIITSPAFKGQATGQVKEIGLQIYKNSILNTDPTAATDARVIEVKVLLDADSSRKIQALTNLEVTVAIQTPSRPQ